MNRMKSRTSLVLMELIITIMFFSLACAVCVRLFVQSHLITRQTEELNKAINICQSICEISNGSDDAGQGITAVYSTATGDIKSLNIYFDSEFNEADAKSASYVANVMIRNDGAIAYTDVAFTKSDTGEEIYSLSSSKFVK